MEPTPDLGLGDSSLHRYLDGEFWSFKNELRRALGSSSLFQPRYPVEWRLLSQPGLARFAPGEVGWGVSCSLVAASLILTSGEEGNLAEVWSQPATFPFLSS